MSIYFWKKNQVYLLSYLADLAWLRLASTFFCIARSPRLSVLLNQETTSVLRMMWLESSLSTWVFFCPCVKVLAFDWLYLLAFSLLDQLIPSLDWYLAELEHVWSWNKSPIINKYPMEPFRFYLGEKSLLSSEFFDVGDPLVFLCAKCLERKTLSTN